MQSGGGYYYPVEGGVPACFSADTIVRTLNGDIAMKDLEVGELVLTKFGNTVSLDTELKITKDFLNWSECLLLKL